MLSLLMLLRKPKLWGSDHHSSINWAIIAGAAFTSPGEHHPCGHFQRAIWAGNYGSNAGNTGVDSGGFVQLEYSRGNAIGRTERDGSTAATIGMGPDRGGGRHGFDPINRRGAMPVNQIPSDGSFVVAVRTVGDPLTLVNLAQGADGLCFYWSP
jgi:hypothetical protein